MIFISQQIHKIIIKIQIKDIETNFNIHTTGQQDDIFIVNLFLKINHYLFCFFLLMGS